MLANDQYAVAQREALVGIGRNRGIERRMPNRDAGRRSNNPADVLVVAVPQLDTERQAGWDVVQVGIGQFAEQTVDAVIERR